MTIILTDPELIEAIEARAKKQNTSIEALLKETFVKSEVQMDEAPVPYIPNPKDPNVRDVYLKAYRKARAYWQSVGDTQRANLTDDELDELFRAFDENGIPRFKDELPDEPPVGSLAYAGKMASQANIRTNSGFDASTADDVLDAELANSLDDELRGIIHE